MTQQLPPWVANWWRPIETAPKDGEVVLVSDGKVVGEAKYHDEHGWYWAGSDPTDYWDGEACGVTHWMPLPPPSRAGAVGELKTGGKDD